MAPETASPSPTDPSDRLRTSVQVLFVGVFLVLASVLAGSLLFHRWEAVENGARRAENLSFILGDHLVRTVSGVDTTLSHLALVGQRVGMKAGNEAWSPVLDAAKPGVSGIAILAVADETGTIRHATIPELVGQGRADTYLFRRLASEPGAGLVADTPFRGRSGRWVIPLGRRLGGPDSQFAGVVVATLEPEMLRGFYRTIDVGRDGFISVLHPDGSVVFREPSARDVTGEPAKETDRLRSVKDGSGVLRGPLEPNGPAYITAYRALANPPLILSVSLSQSELLAGWLTTVAISTAIVAGFGVLLILAWGMIMREIQARADANRQIVAQSKQLAAAITRQDATDAALRANQAQFRSVMHHAPMMMSLKDRDGRYTFVNEAFQKFTGRGPDTVLGKTVADLNSKEFAEFIAAEDRRAMETRQVVQREITTQPEHGSRTALLMKFPVLDEKGEVSGVGTVVTDVTEKKKLEAHLAQTQRIEALGQLTGGIAHDFNNLLTSILLNADVLTSMLDDKLRPLAESVRTAAERGADLTRRLLAFGRRQMLEPRPTDVKDLLAGMMPLIHRTIGECIEIESRHAADVWLATVDPTQLESAVLNLCVNARDAMPKGGRLTIETANIEFDADQAAAFPEIKPGQYVMIAVGDTGTGMTADVLAHAFEPFFSTKDVGKGTGLGLSMVYGFCKQSGGLARLYSEVGVGTVARLYLPRAEVADVAAGVATTAPSELPVGKETILFVEDDAMVRQHTGRQIVGLGYNVVAAQSAIEALALVEKGCVPDLLFTDVVMPGGMNGRQLALKLRERWPHLRVLYTSGYAQGALTIDGESVPSKYVLGKPYRRADLAAKLRDVLDETAAAAK